MRVVLLISVRVWVSVQVCDVGSYVAVGTWCGMGDCMGGDGGTGVGIGDNSGVGVDDDADTCVGGGVCTSACAGVGVVIYVGV